MQPRLLSLLFLLLLLPAQAQESSTTRYYIDEREVSGANVDSLSAERIESITNSVDESRPVVRIRLKPEMNGANDPANKIYEQTTRLKKGMQAADFTLDKYTGGTVTLADLRGKTVLLTFWATWCGPCLRELAPEELPERVLKRFADDPDFVFLPVAVDTRENLDRFFTGDSGKKYGYLRDIATLDPDRDIFGLFAEKGIPRSFVIDREGTIVYGSLGASDGELEKIAEAIDKAAGK